MIWKVQGCIKKPTYDIYFSCGFVFSKRLRHLVSRFTPENERLATIRLKTKFFNISLICAHAPTADIYDRCPFNDLKILLGTFNTKVGQESIFLPIIGRFSLHETSSNNGNRLIDFAALRNMVVRSTMFRHLDTHEPTWCSPDQFTRNQLDHVS